MKKILLLLALTVIVNFAVLAQDNSNSNSKRDEAKWTSLSYVNVPVLKVLDGKDAYVVIYQKNRTGVGTTVVPKAWARGNPENPKKLKFRNAKNPNEAFMTIIRKEGDFKRVVLTIPTNRSSGLWGVVDYHKELSGTDKENLDDVEL